MVLISIKGLPFDVERCYVNVVVMKPIKIIIINGLERYSTAFGDFLNENSLNLV